VVPVGGSVAVGAVPDGSVAVGAAPVGFGGSRSGSG